MIRKIGAALVMAAGALAVVGVAAPAYATAGPGNRTIEAGDVVVWKDTGCSTTAGAFWDYGTTAVYPNGVPNGGDNSFYAVVSGVTTYYPIDGNVSGIANYSAVYVRTYVNSNFTGSYLQLLPYPVTSGTLSYGYCSVGSLDNDLSSHQPAGAP